MLAPSLRVSRELDCMYCVYLYFLFVTLCILCSIHEVPSQLIDLTSFTDMLDHSVIGLHVHAVYMYMYSTCTIKNVTLYPKLWRMKVLFIMNLPHMYM